MVLIFGTMLILTICNVIARSFLGYDILWAQAASVAGLQTAGFLGAGVAHEQDKYARVRLLHDSLAPSAAEHLDAALDTLIAVISAVLAIVSIRFCITSRDIISPELHISELWLNIGMPIGLASVAIFSMLHLAERWSQSWPSIVVTLLIMGGISYLVARPGVSNSAAQLDVITLGSTIFLLIVGLPIAFAFLIASVLYLHAAHTTMLTVPSALADGLSSFLLLAIPFFLIAGFLLGEGGLSRYLTEAAQAIVRRLPGSVLHVIVVTMFVFSGISGSKLADIAGVSAPVFEMTDKEQISRDEAVAVLATSASMGDTIPPSLGMIVLSSVAAISTGALFLAGLVPAVITAVLIMACIFFRWRHRYVPDGARQSPRRLGRKLLQSLPVVFVLVLIVGGIAGGYSTPEEASAIAVAYTILLVALYSISSRIGRTRRMARRQPREILDERPRVSIFAPGREASVTAGSILFLLATASLFGRSITTLGLPEDISRGLEGLHSRTLFLIVSVIALCVMGMVMEGLPAILVFGPILLPVATSLGVSPIQYGIILVMAIGIGANAPPIGIGLYIAVQMGGTTMGRAGRIAVIYLLPLFAGLGVVMAVPWVSLALPKMLGLTS